MDRAYSARFDGIAICSGSKPNRLYGSGRFGRIADLVQIGSKVRRRRIADIADHGLGRLNWAEGCRPMIAPQCRGLRRKQSFNPIILGLTTTLPSLPLMSRATPSGSDHLAVFLDEAADVGVRQDLEYRF
jgi:hypothetical protein